MSDDPRTTIAAAPMHWRQVVVVALCIALNALDGFDVLAISFASPGIAAEWRIDTAALGVVLSMELLGMAAGSVLIGNLADRIGRRPVIVGCLVVMIAGMFAASLASDVTMLSGARLLTGLGIGGMLSTTSAMVAEFANARRRVLPRRSTSPAIRPGRCSAGWWHPRCWRTGANGGWCSRSAGS